MRQHISIEQLNELSEKGKERLHKYLGMDRNIAIDSPQKYLKVALLSIGQMIEFLGDKLSSIYKQRNEYLIVFLVHDVRFREASEELCDALWEAVKEVLTK